jgi:Tfp pilus assembly protein PilZ
MALFIERRKQYRLPFEDKVIFTDGNRSLTAYASNISKGGLFVTSVEPYPIETKGHIAFFLPGQDKCLSFKAKIVHIVFDRQRCEVDNGMGFMFADVTAEQQAVLNNHLEREQDAYLELKKVLSSERPNSEEISRCLKGLPSLRRHELLALRYKVNRICTLFEATPELQAGGPLRQASVS